MKSSVINIVISVIVVSIIIMNLLCSCSKVRPYSPDTIFTHQYPYEGFGTLHYYNNNPQTSDESINNYLINSQLSGECNKVHGFDGLFCKPYTADGKIDKFSEVQGDPKCFGKSSGLSNSKGSLCLGNDLTNLLQTRGGNQTGKSDQYA